MDHTQIEVSANDTIEDVAQRLVANAPSSCIYEGVEIVTEKGQVPSNIIKEFNRFRQSADIKRRLSVFAISPVEVIAVESPGPGGVMDPSKEIKNPVNGSLYVLFERRTDNSVGTVAVVVGARGCKLGVLSSPVVTALGSLIVEHSFREAASEARIEALDLRLSQLEDAAKTKKKS